MPDQDKNCTEDCHHFSCATRAAATLCVMHQNRSRSECLVRPNCACRAEPQNGDCGPVTSAQWAAPMLALAPILFSNSCPVCGPAYALHLAVTSVSARSLLRTQARFSSTYQSFAARSVRLCKDALAYLQQCLPDVTAVLVPDTVIHTSNIPHSVPLRSKCTGGFCNKDVLILIVLVSRD